MHQAGILSDLIWSGNITAKFIRFSFYTWFQLVITPASTTLLPTGLFFPFDSRACSLAAFETEGSRGVALNLSQHGTLGRGSKAHQVLDRPAVPQLRAPLSLLKS